jgi:hypothetical protein
MYESADASPRWSASNMREIVADVFMRGQYDLSTIGLLQFFQQQKSVFFFFFVIVYHITTHPIYS